MSCFTSLSEKENMTNWIEAARYKRQKQDFVQLLFQFIVYPDTHSMVHTQQYHAKNPLNFTV